MVLLDSADEFFSELEKMFALCKERGAGTVYIMLKMVESGNKKQREKTAHNIAKAGAAAGTKQAPGGGGRREGWLARAKISNKKARKISVMVSDAEVAQCRERIEAVKKSMPVCTIAGGTKKRGRKAGYPTAGAAAANSGKRTKGGDAGAREI